MGETVDDERVGHWAVVVADVVVAAVDEAESVPVGSSCGALSFAGASMMTVRVLVEVRPFWSVAT